MARDQYDRVSPERAKHLERNRIAANKCRIKKKREHQQIQNCLHDETARHDSLMAELSNLREEIWTLKNTVFAHASCNDSEINRQLANMSQSLVGASPEQLQLPSPTFSSQSWSDGSPEVNGIESNMSSGLSGALPTVPLMDPALFDGINDGTGMATGTGTGTGMESGTSEFNAFDRFIDMDNS